MNIEPVLRVLAAMAAPYALIGGRALAVRGYPRFTVDVDLLTSDPRVLDPDVWSPLASEGASIDARRGDAEDPLGGVVHILLAGGSDVDVVVAKWKWEANLIARAERMRIGDVELPVATTADLILLKLAAGGYIDRQDAAALLVHADRDHVMRGVEAHIDEVRPDVRAAWMDLLKHIR